MPRTTPYIDEKSNDDDRAVKSSKQQHMTNDEDGARGIDDPDTMLLFHSQLRQQREDPPTESTTMEDDDDDDDDDDNDEIHIRSKHTKSPPSMNVVPVLLTTAITSPSPNKLVASTSNREIVTVAQQEVVPSQTTATSSSVTITRYEATEKLGLSMKRDEHKRLIISNITPNGVVAMQTYLKVGDVVLQIGNVDCCHDLPVRDAVALVRDQSLSPQGVALVVDVSTRQQNETKQETVTIIRYEAAEKLGLSMKRDAHKRLVISNITPNGVVARQTFFRLVMLCYKLVMWAAFVMNCCRCVMLVREQSLSPQGVTMVVDTSARQHYDTKKQEIQRTNTVTIKRDDAAEKLGLSMKRDERKRLIISNITPTGVVAMQTFLHVGDVVLRIGNMDCCHDDLSVRDAVELVREQSLTPQGVTLVVMMNTLHRQIQRDGGTTLGALQPDQNNEQNDDVIEQIESCCDLLVSLLELFVGR